MVPPALLTVEKQRRMCLTADHLACATFAAASALRDPPPVEGDAVREATRRVTARTTPLVFDHGRLALSAPSAAFRFDRSVGQSALVVLMIVAFMAILVARLTSGGDPSAAAGPTAAASSVVSRSSGDGDTAATRAPGAVGASPGDPQGPAASGAADTYTVRAGDTLISIAARSGVSWQALAAANEIDDPGTLRVGQVLELP